MNDFFDKPTLFFYRKRDHVSEILKTFPGSKMVLLDGNVRDKVKIFDNTPARFVFVLPNSQLADAAMNCRELKNTEVYVFPTDLLPVTAEPIRIDLTKPRLDYMETEIAEFCNLNCKGCSDFSNLATGRQFYPYEEFCSDLLALKKLFWGVEKFRILGGEPLLNPAVAEYTEAVRAVFPDCDLRIVSNGLLLPKIAKDTLLRFKQVGVGFDISNYPPTQKNKKEISAVLDAAEIDYRFSFPIKIFFKNIREFPIEDPAPAFRNCIFTHCHMMGHGKLAPCSYAYCISRFNTRYGTHYPENDYVDLYNPNMDGWDIMEAFSLPHDFCRCCGRAIIPFRWQGNVSAENASEKDWQISNGFFTTSIGPHVQHLLKPAAILLREKAHQRNKR